MSEHENVKIYDGDWRSSLTDCYTILKPLALEKRYNSNYHHGKNTSITKGTIVKATIQHIIFLESAIKKVLKEKQSKSPREPSKNFKYYQQIFAKKLQEKLLDRGEKYWRDKRTLTCCCSPCGQIIEIPSQETKRIKTDPEEISTVLTSGLSSPKNSCVTATANLQRIFPREPKELNELQQTSKERVEPKSKCVKNLACEFENVSNSPPQQIQEFEGLLCFYKTITQLLENVIPVPLASSDCVTQFIAKLWSQLPHEDKTIYERVATHNLPSDQHLGDINDNSFLDHLPDLEQFDHFEQLIAN